MLKECNLSGASWWHSNQKKYPNSNRIVDLEPRFRANVSAFVKNLKENNARVRITSTLRNRKRALLMNYSWRISKGSLKPDKVPQIKGIDIDWNHGNLAKSKKAAQEMVRLFNLVHKPSTKSNHIRGKAIDMYVNWKDSLLMSKPGNSGLYYIDSKPRNGNNTDLHKIGKAYGVVKLVSDPPHWSHNGR